LSFHTVLEYLAIDTGKLYHHKMRLDSIFRKPNLTRIDVLDYVKNKHHLYFLNGKVKDSQLLKFIDKILARAGKGKVSLEKVEKHHNMGPNSNYNQDDDFDYLNDDEYEEDYEDYEEPEDKPPKVETKKEVPKVAAMFNKNTFMTYCEEYEESNGEEGAAEWDLDMDASADFV
jgi:hypothetical protein